MNTPEEAVPDPSAPGSAHFHTRPQAGRRPSLPSYNINHSHRTASHEHPSDEEGTIIGENDEPGAREPHHNPDFRPPQRHGSYLTVQDDYDHDEHHRDRSSHSQTREEAYRLNDDLAVLKIERQISRQVAAEEASVKDGSRNPRHHAEPVDEFDIATNPVHETTQVYKPVENPVTGFGKFVRRIHRSNFLIRYVTYIAPVTLILLIPLLLGALEFNDGTNVGGVYLFWFMVWLEIVWLTLWAGRILAKCLPFPLGLVASLFTNNSKKWRDMGKQLELPATLFFWWLAIEVSFLPTMLNHQVTHPASHVPGWMNTMNKVLVSIFVATILNFVEKIIIQLIAISFHLRTYADRIDINKFQISSLTKLYQFSKEKIAMDDRDFEVPSGELPSGARTPGAILSGAIMGATKTSKAAFNRFGDVAGKVAGDFTGRQVEKSTHPSQVVLTLLNSTTGSQVLARRLYRTFAREDTETVFADDLRAAFDNDDEANAAFTMFDKDMNGDISMEELEAVCVEIGRERKSVTASLKDLDSVISKLDDVLVFIVCVITVLVFISLISTSAAAVVTSAGSTVLALSWLFSATAQEFLQSVIFVFVKHPFDVGDRVTVYGNTGPLLRGDDYFVKEISLLYTEFKKMEGHIVQAPNSYLNTLFILNQRRSGGLAEAITIAIKFGTTLDQIEGLRNQLLAFVQAEKREYQSNILTELREIVDVHSMNLNVVFFYKSNWQNEGLRLARRNKFICALMVTMQDLGIEGPQMRYPGQRQSFPVYLQNVPHTSTGPGYGGHPDNPMGIIPEEPSGVQDPPFVAPGPDSHDAAFRSTSVRRGPSVARSRPRGESLSQMTRRVDFSLGARNIVSGDLAGDVYDDRPGPRISLDVIHAARDRSEQRSTGRPSNDSIRPSRDFGRSTSTDTAPGGGLARRATDSSARLRAGSVHRNRFLSRYRSNNAGDDAAALESGMADIPETASPPTETAQTPAGALSRSTIDPRSGLVSAAAYRADPGERVARPPPPTGPRTSREDRRSLNLPRTEVLEVEMAQLK